VVLGVRYRAGGPGVEGDVVEALAPLTVACDGCFSRLRKAVAPAAKVEVTSTFVGLVVEGPERLPFPEHGHVVLIDPAPVLFYPISGTEIRCLVDVPKAKSSMGHVEYLLEEVLPQLPEALKEPFKKAVEAGNLKSMPNRVMPALPQLLPGAILLGDSFNMRHPLTGGGMTVALNDVELLRDLLVERPAGTLAQHGGDADAAAAAARRLHAHVTGKFFARRKNLSSTINILANALYAVFCAPPKDDPGAEHARRIREACFDYLSSGGRRTQDPISMLGGLAPSPYLLIGHFFAVALFAVAQNVREGQPILDNWKMFVRAYNIVKPLIDGENVTVLSMIPISRLG